MEKFLHLFASFAAAFGELLTIYPATKCSESLEIERLCNHFAKRSDANMIAKDFSAVGDAMSTAMGSYGVQRKSSRSALIGSEVVCTSAATKVTL